LSELSSGTAGKSCRHPFDVVESLMLDSRDMQTRVALWASLASFGWPTPPREPLSKAELIEEERVRRAMLEARKLASPEDFNTACRSMRILIGYKSCG
jgi:hypothetical protein